MGYEAEKSKFEAAHLLKLEAMAVRDMYMNRTATLQEQLLDKEQVSDWQQVKLPWR